MTWSSTADLGMRLDRNYPPTGQPRDTVFGTLLPQLGLDGGTRTTRLQMTGSSLFGYWFGPSLQGTEQRFLSLDRVSDRASLRAGSAWSLSDSLSVGGHYLRSHDPFELGAWSALTVADVREWNAWGRGSLWRLEGAYRIDDWSYQAAGEEDARAIAWSASVLPVRRRYDAWLVGWRERRLGLRSVASVVSHAAVLGYRRMLAQSLWVNCEAGVGDVRYSDGIHQTGMTAGLTLGGADASPEGLMPRLHIWQDVATNVTIEVAHRLGDGRVSLRWESLADVQGGIYRDPTFIRQLVIGARDTLARSMVLEFEGSYGHTRPFHFVGPETEIVRASGWLVRRVRPWLIGHGGCSFLRQGGVGTPSEPVLRRVRLEVALAAYSP
jgi:hypothetical protein